MKAKKKTTAAAAAPAKAAVAAAPARKMVTFTLKDQPGKTVALAGSFNDWQTDQNQMTDKNGDGVYRCRIALAPGEYQYKFVVDGEWRSDCENDNWIANEFGSFNSILKVEKK